MSKAKKATDVADVLVAKLGLSPADAARRAKSLSDEQRTVVEQLGRLPMANNLLEGFFNLLAQEKAAKAATKPETKAALEKSLVEARRAFDQSLAEVVSQVPVAVAEATTDEGSAQSPSENESGDSSTPSDPKADKNKKK